MINQTSKLPAQEVRKPHDAITVSRKHERDAEGLQRGDGRAVVEDEGARRDLAKLQHPLALPPRLRRNAVRQLVLHRESCP